VPLTIIVNVSTVKIQFILLFSSTCFGLKGHDQFELKIKRLYVHSLYGIKVVRRHSLCCYVGIQEMYGRIAVGNRIYISRFIIFRKDWMKNLSM